MRRRLLTIGIFLLAGAVVNVGVAWGCSVWIDVQNGSRRGVIQQSEFDAIEWRYSIYRRRGATRIYLFRVRLENGRRYEALPPVPARLPPDVPRWHRGWPWESQVSWDGREFPRTHEARGWPLLSMWSEYFMHGDQTVEELRANPGSLTYTTLAYRGIAIKTITRPSEQRVLPLGIFWPGFAVNTLFYAVLLWLLIPGPFALRRLIRVRRGLCPKCAYPMGESGVCTECGNELPQRVRPPAPDAASGFRPRMDFAPSTIVRPRIQTWALLAWSAGGGFMCGVAAFLLLHPDSSLVVYACFRILQVLPPPISQLWPILLLLLLASPFALRCAKRCQRFWPVYFSGQCFGSFLGIGYLGGWAIKSAFIDHWFSALIVLVVLALAGIPFGLANLLIRYFNLAFRFRIIEQDGTRCWRCGYIVGSPPGVDKCSECGQPIGSQSEQQVVRSGARKTAMRLLRIVFVLFVVWLLVALLVRVATYGVRTSDILSAINASTPPHGIPMLRIGVRANRFEMIGAWETPGVLQEISGHPDKVLAICVASAPEDGQPHMQLQLLAKFVKRGHMIGEYGDPVVICNLDRRHVEFIKQSGLPDSLIESMTDAAIAAGWQPTLPVPGSFAGFILVEPDEHFPPTAAAP